MSDELCPHVLCNRTKLERDEADAECALSMCPYRAEEDPAYAKPLPPVWALDEAARRYGFKNWLQVPTLFKTPTNRAVIVDARVLIRKRQA